MVLPFHQNEIMRHKRMGRTDCSIHPKFIGINGVRTGESVAESVSALVAATGKNLAAVSGSHSLSEAMNFLAMELLGLIGTLRHLYTPPELLCSTAGYAAACHSNAVPWTGNDYYTGKDGKMSTFCNEFSRRNLKNIAGNQPRRRDSWGARMQLMVKSTPSAASSAVRS